ncbi:MAG: ATP-grasp domain-containing protein [Phycisphaerales bacterium]
MNITVLTYLESERSKTWDVVVDQVAAELRAAGHDASILAIHSHLDKLLDGLTRPRPDLVFNLMEMFNRDYFGDVDVAGFLDLLDLPHTGGGAGELYLQQDKSITKKLLASEGIKYPRYMVVAPGAAPDSLGDLRPPLFVKPLRTDASIGISERSIVKDFSSLVKQVRSIHEKVDDAALVEEYIDGREFYVSVLGNNGDRLALAPVELDFSGLPEGSPRVADAAAKWTRSSARYKGTKSVIANLPGDVDDQLRQTASAACKVLEVRDYGRVDIRLTDSGEVYVIEVNGNCYLEKSSELSMAAKASGIEYHDLVLRIVDTAMARYKDKKMRRPKRAPLTPPPPPPIPQAQAADQAK